MSSGAVPDPKMLKSLPPAYLAQIPAQSPPPGVIPNFEHPETRVPVLLGVGTAFFIFALVCYGLRIYTKIAIAKKWKWDDLTISLGFAFAIVYYAFVVNGSVHGATGRHEYEIHIDKALSHQGLEQSYVTTIMVTPALGLIKLSLFIQYYILFGVLRWVRISTWVGATLSGLFYVTVTISAFVLTSPWPHEDLLDDILSSHYLKFAQFSIPTGVIGMLVDWTLLILPMPAVLNLKMNLGKKIGLMVVFATGGLAAIASIVSLYYRVVLQRGGSDDATWKVAYVLLWSQIEMFAGVAASSMPTVRQFFTSKSISLSSLGSSFKTSLQHLRSKSSLRFTSRSSRASRGSKSSHNEKLSHSDSDSDRGSGNKPWNYVGTGHGSWNYVGTGNGSYNPNSQFNPNSSYVDVERGSSDTAKRSASESDKSVQLHSFGADRNPAVVGGQGDGIKLTQGYEVTTEKRNGENAGLMPARPARAAEGPFGLRSFH